MARTRKRIHLRFGLIIRLPELAHTPGYLPLIGEVAGELTVDRAVVKTGMADVVIEEIGLLERGRIRTVTIRNDICKSVEGSTGVVIVRIGRSRQMGPGRETRQRLRVGEHGFLFPEN